MQFEHCIHSTRGPARAHGEIGSVLSVTSESRRALESYERSLAIYKELVNVRDRETKDAAKIEMQRVRKIIVALVHEPPEPGGTKHKALSSRYKN